MKTKLVLCSMLLGSWMALGAQQQPAPPGPEMPGSTSPRSSPQQPPAAQASPPTQSTTVEGCLSSSNGNYSVTDSSGSVTQLQVPSSQIAKLAPFEGKQVQVSGTPLSAGSTGAASSAPNPPMGTDTGSSSRQGSRQLAATAIRLVAETCSNAKPSPK